MVGFTPKKFKCSKKSEKKHINQLKIIGRHYSNAIDVTITGLLVRPVVCFRGFRKLIFFLTTIQKPSENVSTKFQ